MAAPATDGVFTRLDTFTAITGGSGHVGAAFVRALLEEGRHVRALVHHDTAALEDVEAWRVPGDVLDQASLERAFAGAEVVYHLAAAISLRSWRDPAARRVNVDGTRKVVAACLASGVRRLVHFSSIHAFSAIPTDAAVNEARPLCGDRKGLPYDRSKADGEREVLAGVEQGLDAVIVNPTSVIGPYDFKPSAMGQVLLSLARGRFPALVRAGYNWVDVRDVCRGAMLAERAGRTGEKYLLAGHYLTLEQLAGLVQEVTGTKAPAFEVPLWLAHAGLPFASIGRLVTGKRPLFTLASLRALRHHQVVSDTKAREALGYAPRPIRQTIEDTFAWYRSRGYL